MKKIDATDAARVDLMLGELRLPEHQDGMGRVGGTTADKEGWPAYSGFLAAIWPNTRSPSAADGGSPAI